MMRNNDEFLQSVYLWVDGGNFEFVGVRWVSLHRLFVGVTVNFGLQRMRNNDE